MNKNIARLLQPVVPAEAASLEAVRGYIEKAWEILEDRSEWDLQEMILAVRYKLSDRIATERNREAAGGKGACSADRRPTAGELKQKRLERELGELEAEYDRASRMYWAAVFGSDEEAIAIRRRSLAVQGLDAKRRELAEPSTSGAVEPGQPK